MKLICVRHGETFFNLQGRIQGQSDTQLSPMGRRQCQAVAAQLAGLDVEAIITSPLARAAETAQYLADALQTDPKPDPRLMEINAGIFQGHTWTEINDKFPDVAALWRSGDPDFRIPKGESRRDVMLRAGAAFGDIREAGYRLAIIVAHGGSLSAALKALLEVPARHNPFTFSNGSISTLLWESELKVHSLNETGHLRDLVSGDGEL